MDAARRFAKALKRANLSGFRLYDLRHTFATLLLSRGVPITYVSAQLGHAKPTATLQWYSHWLPAPDSNRFVDGLDGTPIIYGTSLAPNGSWMMCMGLNAKKKPLLPGAFRVGRPRLELGTR